MDSVSGREGGGLLESDLSDLDESDLTAMKSLITDETKTPLSWRKVG
jgi:hypothetical protein